MKSLCELVQGKRLTQKGSYLVIGCFMPENSFKAMICEFMESGSKKDFALIMNTNDKFLSELEEKINFKDDKKIKFAGTVYAQKRLIRI